MTPEQHSIAGHNNLSARALQKVVTAIAADQLRVAPKDVNVRLSDDRGLLAIDVAAPLRVAGLGRTTVEPGILRRTQAAQTDIQTRTVQITGSQVRTVALRITRAIILEERRVL